ncbi:hypothetical protein DACRYDRAFT_22083 [Dacryopinax primogenitus]|uniref:Uncharacterized protein n=1 Tax=Dacryopinax primogenitus (strain DJM 731) TaxID=1858805 RepID=M5G9A1_DACPD|nr:uncharacterized protein DACRYDRAFT_22083 [Dacryopinax primogenitus]EJU02442.1 hypothetical protein DACRYDRAFT_22083 [Dacryopinax primogenitus]
MAHAQIDELDDWLQGEDCVCSTAYITDRSQDSVVAVFAVAAVCRLRDDVIALETHFLWLVITDDRPHTQGNFGIYFCGYQGHARQASSAETDKVGGPCRGVDFP